MATINRQGSANGVIDWMDRERFLKEYHLELAYEFLQDGKAAEWAHNGHRYWNGEDDSIPLETNDKMSDYHPDVAGALSPDSRFLAVATNSVIRLYDVKSKKVVSELKGHEDNVKRLYFAPQPGEGSGVGNGRAYTLVSCDMHGYHEGHTFIWHLDEEGMHYGPMKMLHGELPVFGFANPISNDGRKVITLEKNQSTQQGMRPLEEMPRIVVRNLDTLSEEWRLTGHQDGIMWAGWSPDNKWIADASWDETFGIWNPKVNNRAEGHLIGPSDGQNWVGDFSADGRYVVFSGGSTTKVTVHEVETGEEVSVLDLSRLSRPTEWVRELKWSPVDYSMVLVLAQEVVVWKPLEGSTPSGKLKIVTDGTLLTGYNGLTLVQWVDEGRKLVVRDVANTIYVWDMEENVKWRFQRPDGLDLEVNPLEVCFMKDLGERGTILSLDGDWQVRYWTL